MKNIVFICCFLILGWGLPAAAAGPAADPAITEYIDVVFENSDLEMAVLILINEKNFPVADVIDKARSMSFSYTQIIEALIDTNLTCEEVMVAALLNGAPAAALFDSKKIRDDYDYTPEKILEFLVAELRFMARDEEERSEKDHNLGARNANMEVIIRVCKSMMEEKNFSPFDVMSLLCRAEAGNALIAAVAERFDVPPAVAFKACPRHAEYGHAYVSHELPHKAYIVIGVDHITLDDDAGNRGGVISPMRP